MTRKIAFILFFTIVMVAAIVVVWDFITNDFPGLPEGIEHACPTDDHELKIEGDGIPNTYVWCMNEIGQADGRYTKYHDSVIVENGWYVDGIRQSEFHLWKYDGNQERTHLLTIDYEDGEWSRKEYQRGNNSWRLVENHPELNMVIEYQVIGSGGIGHKTRYVRSEGNNYVKCGIELWMENWRNEKNVTYTTKVHDLPCPTMQK